MPNPTLRPHHNLLAELAAELKTEAEEHRRRGDDLATRDFQTDTERLALARARGIQDALTNAAGRVHAILIAPLTAIVDPFELHDELLDRLNAAAVGAGSTHLPLSTSTSARLCVELLDGLPVGGTR